MVRQLELTTDVATLGIGRSKGIPTRQNDRVPVTILRVGLRYLVPANAS